jgi:hypothetical protein
VKASLLSLITPLDQSSVRDVGVGGVLGWMNSVIKGMYKKADSLLPKNPSHDTGAGVCCSEAGNKGDDSAQKSSKFPQTREHEDGRQALASSASVVTVTLFHSESQRYPFHDRSELQARVVSLYHVPQIQPNSTEASRRVVM